MAAPSYTIGNILAWHMTAFFFDVWVLGSLESSNRCSFEVSNYLDPFSFMYTRQRALTAPKFTSKNQDALGSYWSNPQAKCSKQCDFVPMFDRYGCYWLKLYVSDRPMEQAKTLTAGRHDIKISQCYYNLIFLEGGGKLKWQSHIIESREGVCKNFLIINVKSLIAMH